MTSYACNLIDMAHEGPMNRIMNDYYQDSGDNLSQPLSATGADPATHRYGGVYVDDAWLAVFQNFDTAPYVPRDGYPLADGTTEQQALDAQAAFQCFVQTKQGDSSSLPTLAQVAMFSATGLKLIEQEL